MCGRLQSIWSCIIDGIPVQTPCIEIHSGTKYHCLAVINAAGKGSDSFTDTILDDQIRHLCLFDGQMILIFQHTSHASAVLTLIRLCSEGMNGRSF